MENQQWYYDSLFQNFYFFDIFISQMNILYVIISCKTLFALALLAVTRWGS